MALKGGKGKGKGDSIPLGRGKGYKGKGEYPSHGRGKDNVDICGLCRDAGLEFHHTWHSCTRIAIRPEWGNQWGQKTPSENHSPRIQGEVARPSKQLPEFFLAAPVEPITAITSVDPSPAPPSLSVPPIKSRPGISNVGTGTEVRKNCVRPRIPPTSLDPVVMVVNAIRHGRAMSPSSDVVQNTALEQDKGEWLPGSKHNSRRGNRKLEGPPPQRPIIAEQSSRQPQSGMLPNTQTLPKIKEKKKPVKLKEDSSNSDEDDKLWAIWEANPHQSLGKNIMDRLIYGSKSDYNRMLKEHTPCGPVASLNPVNILPNNPPSAPVVQHRIAPSGKPPFPPPPHRSNSAPPSISCHATASAKPLDTPPKIKDSQADLRPIKSNSEQGSVTENGSPIPGKIPGVRSERGNTPPPNTPKFRLRPIRSIPGDHPSQFVFEQGSENKSGEPKFDPLVIQDFAAPDHWSAPVSPGQPPGPPPSLVGLG